MGANKMVQVFEAAIDQGKSVLVENMGELIDAVLAPVIGRNTIRRRRLKTKISLEDQLLFLVVKLERSDLACQKSELIVAQNGFKVKLAECETLLLEKLANPQGDILEDVELILSLDEVKEKVIIAQETEAKINETSESYRPVASRGALLFFC
jgi:dynein heavy chain